MPRCDKGLAIQVLTVRLFFFFLLFEEVSDGGFGEEGEGRDSIDFRSTNFSEEGCREGNGPALRRIAGGGRVF